MGVVDTFGSGSGGNMFVFLIREGALGTYSVRVSTNPYVEQKHIYLNGDRLLTKLGRNDKTAGDNSYQRLNQYYNHANHIGSVNVITDHQGRECSYREVPRHPRH